MTKVYSVVGTDHMDIDSLDSFKEYHLLTLTADDARRFINILRIKESDLFNSVMEDIRERYLESYCEESVSNITVLSHSRKNVRAERVLDYFDQATIEAVTKFITAKLYDYGIE